MCLMAIPPAVIAGVAIAATVASTAVGVVAAQQQASSQADAANANAAAQNMAAKYNAQVQANNAMVARQNAQMQMDQAAAEARRIRIVGQRQQGAARAAAAASGIDPLGSFEDVAYDSLIDNETDARNAIYRGQVNAWNSMVEAGNYDAAAGLSKAKGQYALQAGSIEASGARRAGILSGIGTGISGASTAVGQANRAGFFA
jgi:hypothetical protein